MSSSTRWGIGCKSQVSDSHSFSMGKADPVWDSSSLSRHVNLSVEKSPAWLSHDALELVGCLWGWQKRETRLWVLVWWGQVAIASYLYLLLFTFLVWKSEARKGSLPRMAAGLQRKKTSRERVPSTVLAPYSQGMVAIIKMTTAWK